jgi:CubicO group peptidase (beta-lactamase class C family)
MFRSTSRAWLIGLSLVTAAAPSASLAAERSSVATPALPAAAPESLGFDPARLRRLDDYIAGRVAGGDVAGATYLLARHGKLVAFNSHGKQSLATGTPVRPDTIFRIYSMTKPVTGVAMMMLFEEGKWRFDDPITKFIPEFANLKVMTGTDAAGKPIVEDMKRPPTMRELMSHTAGFGYGLSDQSVSDKLYRAKGPLQAAGSQQLIERLAQLPLNFQPGTDWEYSIAVDIQGYIVEKLSGQSLGEFFEKRIFNPLKMHDTGFFAPKSEAGRLAALYVGDGKDRLKEAPDIWQWPVPDYLSQPALESGGYGLVSTTMDYARFCQMLLNKGELDGVRVLAPATVELMTTNAIPDAVLAKGSGGYGKNAGFGMDVRVVNNPRALGSLEGAGTFSWGGAAGTWFWVDPTNDLLFVGMIQRMDIWSEGEMSEPTRTLTYQALVKPER